MEDLGLSENEAAIYLYLLKNGQKPVQKIAKGTKLSRVTVYSAIESLSNLGLVSNLQKGKRKLFTAEPPERVISIAENNLKKMESTVKEMKSQIQELKLLQSGDKPVVKFFEGPEAYRAVYEDLIESQPKDIYEFGNIKDIHATYSKDDEIIFSSLQKKVNEIFVQRDVKRRLIYLGNYDPAFFVDMGDVKRIFLDDNKYDFHGDIFLYGKKKIWFSSFRGRQMSVLIESEILYQTMKSALEIIWESQKKGPVRK